MLDIEGMKSWVMYWRRRIRRDLNDLELRLFRPSVIVLAGQEVDIESGRYNVISVREDGVLNLTGPVSCYRLELLGGRINEFISRDFFYTAKFIVRDGSMRSMRRRVRP